jgi:peptidoglycan/LPS O-acetylase OafA/YrhL
MTMPQRTQVDASLASPSPFDPRLEALRGVATLMVCVFHAMQVFASNPQPALTDALFSTFNPAAAVMFFFVLSGYVLGGSLERDGAITPYLARRLFRLVPPFAAAVLFAFACERLLRLDPAPSGLTPGFQRLFWPQPTWDDLWNNLLLGSNSVNGPTWTLYPELLGSMMLPFVVAAHGRIEPRWRWGLFAAITTLLAIGPYQTLLWFYFGCFLVKEFAVLLAGRKQLAVVSFIAGLVGLEIAGAHNEFYTVGVVIPSAIAAALMMGAVVSSRDMLRWTTTSSLRFLGRISFSLYLVHWPIFYICALVAVVCDSIVPTQTWGNLLVMMTSLIIAIGIAALSYRFIEAPSIRAGKFVARVLSEMWKDWVVASSGWLRAPSE